MGPRVREGFSSSGAAFAGWALLFLSAGMNPQPPPQEQVEEVARRRKIKKDAESGDDEVTKPEFPILVRPRTPSRRHLVTLANSGHAHYLTDEDTADTPIYLLRPLGCELSSAMAAVTALQSPTHLRRRGAPTCISRDFIELRHGEAPALVAYCVNRRTTLA
jgi:hypothetical protein